MRRNSDYVAVRSLSFATMNLEEDLSIDSPFPNI